PPRFALARGRAQPSNVIIPSPRGLSQVRCEPPIARKLERPSMTDEQSFLAAVAAYKKKPSKTAALDVWGMYFGPDARKPVRVSQIVRENLRQAVEKMRAAKEERDKDYGGKNPFKAIARIATSKEFRADGGVFDAAATEVERNERLKGIQIAMLELTWM